jgi:hypothetical protein
MIVWSYGGGTQSAAIAVMILKGELPKPDIVCIADTSREVSETWEYLSNVVQPAFDKIGIKIDIIPHNYSYWDIYAGNGDILLPVYTRMGGSIGKLPTYCSNEWKKYPVRRWLRERGVEQCELWLGISTDEMERMKFSDVKWQNYIYPLIEVNPISRIKCISIVEKYGWPTPPRSRCWMCPNMSPADWRKLRDKYPEDFQRAIDLEKQIQEKDSLVYLHPLAIALEEAVNQSDQQSNMFDGCDSGFCWT